MASHTAEDAAHHPAQPRQTVRHSVELPQWMKAKPAPPLGVVLAGGRGTRLAPLTPETPKPLVPLMNCPLLRFALEQFADAGLTETVVVVAAGDDQTAAAASRLVPPGLEVTVARQAAPLGSADALAAVGAALDNRTVIVAAVDTILRSDLAEPIARFRASEAVAGLMLDPTDRPLEMGIAVLDGDRIVHLEEKPRRPRSDLAAVGVWMLGPLAVERVCRCPIPNADGEADLTATMATLVAAGHDVRGWRVDGTWFDAGSIAGLLETQAALLSRIAPARRPVGVESEMHGTIAAGERVSVLRSRLVGPILLGSDVGITDCEIGPGVVVGDGAELRRAKLRHALVASGARVEEKELSEVVVPGPPRKVETRIGRRMRWAAEADRSAAGAATAVGPQDPGVAEK